MTDNEDIAGDGASTATEEVNPFADFISSEFSNGEAVSTAPPVEEAAPSEEGEDDPSSAPPKKQSAQERINEVTRLRREAERRAEALEAELAQLRQRPPQQEEAPKPVEVKPEAAAPQDAVPSPDDFDYGELDPRYIRALASHEARMEFQKLVDRAKKDSDERAAQEERAAAQQRFQQQIDNGSKKHDDFYEKVIIGAEKGQWPLSDHMGKMLVDSDVGDDIAYHLASHPEEAAQVFRQTPLEQARYFGRMEAKFTAGESAATGNGAGKTLETRTPKAPPPVTPARGSDGKFSPSASTNDFSAFEAHANNQ